MLTAFANPTRFAQLLRRLQPWLVFATLALLGAGTYSALLTSPPDYQQGEMVRVMYLHVPAAWWSLSIYMSMALSSAIFLIWRHTVADLIARHSAPIALGMTAITLVTGSLWGKPTWGSYWVWDARLTSMLILFFILMGYHLLARQSDHNEARQKVCAWFCLFGAVNLPIIKFSVNWWNTLHQPASILRSGGSAIATPMLLPLGLMAAGFFTFWLLLLALRIQTALVQAKVARLRARHKKS
jgi:heme exporter protein C